MMMISLEDIVGYLEEHANPAAVEGMARFGIRGAIVYGFSMPALRDMARRIGKNHTLALALFSQGSREARILASLVAETAKVDDDLMEAWAATFDSWEACDQCCMNLFEKIPSAWEKAVEWSARSEEFVKRAGFVLMARLAVSDKKAMNERFIPFLDIIERESSDNRTMVKKAVNWALRQIGKRNPELHARAISTARVLSAGESSAARWIASDALRELESVAVRERLNRKRTQQPVTS